QKRDVTAVAFSPNGVHLASASEDGTVKVWEVQTGQEILSLKGHADRAWAVAFSPDGRLISAINVKGIWQTWEATSGQDLPPTPLTNVGQQRSAISPDRRFRALADDVVARVVDSQPTDEQRA